MDQFKTALRALPVKRLKEEASKYNKSLGIISGYSKMSKEELITEMSKHQDKFKHLMTVPKKEAPKPAPKPAPKKEAPKPAPKMEAPKPAPKVEAPKPAPKIEEIDKSLFNIFIRDVKRAQITNNKALLQSIIAYYEPKIGADNIKYIIDNMIMTPKIEAPKPAPKVEAPKPAPKMEIPKQTLTRNQVELMKLQVEKDNFARNKEEKQMLTKKINKIKKEIKKAAVNDKTKIDKTKIDKKKQSQKMK
jgi:hypothetical protein